MFFYDWTLILLIPALLLSVVAQFMVHSTFQRYARVAVQSGFSGAEAAAALARRRGVAVGIQPSHGFLSDHFDPTHNVLALSPEVYSGRSVAAVGVAAHELGHALQKADNYFPMYLRSFLVPAAQVGSNLSWLLFLAGILMGTPALAHLGILLFSLAVLFTLVTLPVEFDASARALRLLTSEGLVTRSEVSGVRAVLNAAALTYVAAAVMAVLQLVRMILIARSHE
ncbi:MAG: zinc metallopeptidase [Candidatus Eremiobacterota bacterium]